LTNIREDTLHPRERVLKEYGVTGEIEDAPKTFETKFASFYEA
jgi:hypothetical protein